jgi:hypothetical protein
MLCHPSLCICVFRALLAGTILVPGRIPLTARGLCLFVSVLFQAKTGCSAPILIAGTVRVHYLPFYLYMSVFRTLLSGTILVSLVSLTIH